MLKNQGSLVGGAILSRGFPLLSSSISGHYFLYSGSFPILLLQVGGVIMVAF